MFRQSTSQLTDRPTNQPIIRPTNQRTNPGLAAGIYGFWLEQWGVVKALYFGVVTLTRSDPNARMRARSQLCTPRKKGLIRA